MQIGCITEFLDFARNDNDCITSCLPHSAASAHKGHNYMLCFDDELAGEAVSFPYRLRDVHFPDVSGQASQN